MSAIFGILRFDGGAANPRDLERMGNTLAHRGPDGRKFAVGGPIGLGHCLMRVNDEDAFEVLPLSDREADLALVADCRIDNREELAAAFDLSVADIREMPDSAFILRAYKKWGEHAAGHLIGDFAFAVWDGRGKKLVLARDHMGQRYVHYYHGKDFFVFATEIKALWAIADVPRTLSDSKIAGALLSDSRNKNGATLFEGIAGLLGGQTIVVRADGTRTARRYWEPRAGPAHIGRDEAYYVATYRKVLAEAVDCRLRRLAGPAALALSGGYDSTAIAGLAGPAMRAQNRKLIAIASVLSAEKGTHAGARRWIEACRRVMPHLDIRYQSRGTATVLTDADEAIMAADDMPSPVSYLEWARYREASRAGVRLMMDGIGGDGTLTPRGRGILGYFLRSGQFARFAREFWCTLRLSGQSPWRIVRSDVAAPLSPRRLRRLWRRIGSGGMPAWASTPIVPRFAAAMLREGAIDEDEILGLFWRERMLRARMIETLRRVTGLSRTHGTNEAAAQGLELSRPHFDKRVVEFGLAVPVELFVKNGRNRYLACRALADVYPPEFLTRARLHDPAEADFEGSIRDSRGALEAEIERLAAMPELARYVDFEKLKAALMASDAPSKHRRQFGAALIALTLMRTIAWFRGGNA